MIIVMWFLIGFLIVSNVYLLWAHFQNMKTFSNIIYFEEKANDIFLSIANGLSVSEEAKKKIKEIEMLNDRRKGE